MAKLYIPSPVAKDFVEGQLATQFREAFLNHLVSLLAVHEHDDVFLPTRLIKLFLKFCQALYLVQVIFLACLKEALLPRQQRLDVADHVFLLLVQRVLDLHEDLAGLVHLGVGLRLEQGQLLLDSSVLLAKHGLCLFALPELGLKLQAFRLASLFNADHVVALSTSSTTFVLV